MRGSPPVIIIGMGRSGTSILTKLLAELGLFVGEKKNPTTYEAVFFQAINKWLLASCGGGLEHPSAIKWLLEDLEVRDLITDFIQFILHTLRVVSFLGLRNYLKYRTPENLDIPWGWKDPRNTFTLPIWLNIFPDAKVIHIYRHDMSIANSLQRIRDRIVFTSKQNAKKFGKIYWLYWTYKRLPRRRELVGVKSSSLEGAFSIWEEYITEARKHVRLLADRALEVQFKHLMEAPPEVLKNVLEFCELRISINSIEKAAKRVRKERAYAYRSNGELQQFAKKMASRLSHQGY